MENNQLLTQAASAFTVYVPPHLVKDFDPQTQQHVLCNDVKEWLDNNVKSEFVLTHDYDDLAPFGQRWKAKILFDDECESVMFKLTCL